MRTISGQEALSNLRRNQFAIWSDGGNDASPGLDPNYAGHRVQKRFAEVHADTMFSLGPGAKIFAVGSCFAREIEGAFARRGFTVLSNDDSYLRRNYQNQTDEEQTFNQTDFASDQPWGPGNYINRYTTASMLLELQRSIGPFVLPDNAMLYESDGHFTDLHFASGCESGGMSLVRRRRAITREVTQRIAVADLIILTLGLIESWYDRKHSVYINSAPTPLQLRRSGDRFEMRRLGYDDNLANLREIFALAKRANPKASFVVTVSPIPLEATFSADDVVVANTASKAILRAVVDEFCSTHPDVLYFPSFEIVCHSDPSHAWEGDRRHVTSQMIDHVIRTFENG